MKKMVAFLTAILSVTSTAVSMSSFATSDKYLSGDVDLNGVVDIEDGILLKNALWGQETLSDLQRTVADVNGDLHVDFADLMCLNDIINGNAVSDEITVDADENGNVIHLVNDNSALSVISNGWTADVTNNESDSSFRTSAYSMTAKSGNSNMFLNPFFATINNNSASLSYSAYATTSSVKYDDGNQITANVLNNGYLSINDTYFKNSKSVIQKAGETLSYISKDDALFQPTDYSVGGTVELINASITRTEDGFEFCNNISKLTGTSYSYLGHKYASMDGAEFWFDEETESFIIKGIDEDSIEFIHEDVRNSFNGKELVDFNEVSVVTDDYIYGLMYDPSFDYMCAFVRYDRNNGECTLAQYTAAGERATIATHYVQDGVIEEGLANPDLLVEYIDELYDPDNMVFQVVMYGSKMKSSIVGGINDSYRTNNGITFTQTKSGLNIIQAAESDKDTGTTLTFANLYGSDLISISNSAGSIQKYGNTMTYGVGTDTFSNDASESLFSADNEITYKSGNVSETFTIRNLLNNRTATMY